MELAEKSIQGRWKQLKNRIFTAFRREVSAQSDWVFRDLGPGDIAIDCGANVGDVTDRLAKTGAEVHAFEPNPDAFAALSARFKNQPNVHCYQRGVWDRPTTLKLFLHKMASTNPIHYSTGSSLLSCKGNIDPEAFVEVPVIDLVEFIEGLGHFVKFIKIDVEGAECQILPKLLESEILGRVGMVYVETHDHKISELHEPTERIRKIVRERGIRNINLNWT